MERPRRYTVRDGLAESDADMAGVEFDFYAYAPELFHQVRSSAFTYAVVVAHRSL
jgi:hypothetical protein